ncbi:MAG: hypothetical protein LBV19_10495 [Streptococcaceae bacterium]|jgi:hypothetical protein|nr:hypothetical protein [Streptococcaceae bacterium]
MKVLNRFRWGVLVLVLSAGIFMQHLFGENLYFIRTEDVMAAELLTKVYLFAGKLLPFFVLLGYASDNPVNVLTRFSSRRNYWLHKYTKIIGLTVTLALFFAGARNGQDVFVSLFAFIILVSIQQLIELYLSVEISLIAAAFLILAGMFFDFGPLNFLLMNLYRQNLLIIVIVSLFVITATEFLMQRKEIL